jgi:hypothetical protein
MQDSTRAKVSKPCRIPYLPKFRVRLHAAKRIQRFAEAETGPRGILFDSDPAKHSLRTKIARFKSQDLNIKHLFVL